MNDLVPIRRALISVSDKRDLVPFVRALVEHGVEIVSTGGTGRALREAGIEVTGIEEVTGSPEMMDGRVKTLHPAVHAALLARRDIEADLRELRDHGIAPIDLVCVNLYPFERSLRQDLADDEAIELIDIGGPAMVRSGAKNHEFVTVVTSPSQYDRVATELEKTCGSTGLELRREFAAVAFSRTAEYDATISAWMCGRRLAAFPPMLRITQTKKEQLRYGENPHQQAAIYMDPAERGSNVVTADLLHGRLLTYNNLNDAAAAFELVRELREVFPDRAGAAIIKHTNPCGAAIGRDAAESFQRAYEGDSQAAYGGILALNVAIDESAAARICDGEKFFEVIIAPAFAEQAKQALARRWTNVRLLATGATGSGAEVGPIEYRAIPGGMLVQERDRTLADPGKWSHVAGPNPEESQMQTAAFLWMVCKHLKSNAVAVGGGAMLLGAGAGQMDRVTSARLAVEKAGARLREVEYPIATSDGFFPFPDGPQILIDAGVRCIVQPGGSKRDEDTVNLCQQTNVTLLMTGVRHFRH